MESVKPVPMESVKQVVAPSAERWSRKQAPRNGKKLLRRQITAMSIKVRLHPFWHMLVPELFKGRAKTPVKEGADLTATREINAKFA